MGTVLVVKAGNREGAHAYASPTVLNKTRSISVFGHFLPSDFKIWEAGRDGGRDGGGGWGGGGTKKANSGMSVGGESGESGGCTHVHLTDN